MAPPVKAYKYTTEIVQMCFVFGKLIDPDEALLQHMEDIVKSQLAEIMIQARANAARRSARHVTVEDVIFLMRKDPGKVNRIVTYLGWKDVMKKVKDSEAAEEGLDIETMEEPVAEKRSRSSERRAKLPWSIPTVYSEYANEESDAEEDENALNEDAVAIQRLKVADKITQTMTPAQYQYYSEARQASFTHRKIKRFRDFANLGVHENAPNDEVVDVLGFLASEMVRSLCEDGAEAKRCLALAKSRSEASRAQEAASKAAELERINTKKRKREERAAALVKLEEGPVAVAVIPEEPAAPTVDPLSIPRAATPMSKRGGRFDVVHLPRSPPRVLVDPISLFSAPPAGMPLPSPGLGVVPPILGSSGSQVGGLGLSTGISLASKHELEEGVLGTGVRAVLTLEDLGRGIERRAAVKASGTQYGFRNWHSGRGRQRN